MWRGRTLGVAAVVAVAGVGVAACGSSSSKPVSGSAKQTITFAESGLGTEGQETAKAIKGFEAKNKNITVKIQVLSPNSTTYLSQLEHDFIAGSSTPDVLESDVTYPAKFAKAGWIKPLSSFSPNTSQFFPNIVAAGEYKGTPYAIPWFSNPEGLFYRTDLVPTPPKSPAQVVSDAKAATKKDPKLKEGLAFEGAKYEGVITSYLTVNGAFGGHLTLKSVDTPQNTAALTWLHHAIYVNKIAPAAVTGWQEAQVQSEFTSGYTAFAINYPFVASVAAAGGPAKGHVGYIPFPPQSGGRPGSALGGEMLAINAKSGHSAASWKLIQYLTSPSVQIARAEATGDPPSLPSAYTAALFAKSPIFRQVKVLNSDAQPRPVDPNYLQASSDLQDAFTSVYANSTSPSSALKSAASSIKSLGSGG